jgi:hypothetical protein
MNQKNPRTRYSHLIAATLLLTVVCVGFAPPVGAAPQRTVIDLDSLFPLCGSGANCALLLPDARPFDVDRADAYRPRFLTALVPLNLEKPASDRYRQRNVTRAADDFDRAKPDRPWSRKRAVPFD